ncbi:hypothetical protein H2200_001193 [Cladophialophora chaetospira]|uniref:Uncharacterized protein n=1 Tax=Cladophialophora chaetospira TaxID=386627 RepID=A0AA38XKE8_9EURO|nr:hypothetical protein H2200_001193 [Cladophialophora chaetospira]
MGCELLPGEWWLVLWEIVFGPLPYGEEERWPKSRKFFVDRGTQAVRARDPRTVQSLRLDYLSKVLAWDSSQREIPRFKHVRN